MERFPLKPCKTVAQAARCGRLDDLKMLINKGHPVDVSDNRGWKPIHEAAAENHPDCLAELTNNELTCVDWQAFDGSTALLEAAKVGNEICLNILLNGKANPNLCDHMSVTPLMAAVQSRNMACVVSLLLHGADVNSQQYSGLSALHLSVECDLPAVLSHLLDAGALINIRNDFGITPLFLAAHYGRLECLNVIVQHLVKIGQSDVVNLCAEDGASPLFLAAQEGHTDCVRLLLDHGASANLTTTDPVALPLHAALEFNHVECVQLLLPHTDHRICSSCTASAFHFSMIHDDDQATKFLIEAGLDFTKCSLDYDYYPRILRYFSGEVHFGNTVGALSVLAINQNSLVHARALIAAGASLNTKTASSVPPLLPTLDIFNLPLAQMLIEHGANINLYHPKVIGNLSVIVAIDNWKCLNFVLRCGAEVESLLKQESQDSRARLAHFQDSDDDDYETEPGVLSTPIPFWRQLAENRLLMTRTGITVAKALYRILQFTRSIKLDTPIYSYIDSDEDRKALLSLSENPVETFSVLLAVVLMMAYTNHRNKPGKGHTLKVILLGDGGVGKSSLMNVFVNRKFDEQSYHTIGVEFLMKDITINKDTYTLQIWDTAGQERFKSLRTPFYRGADCCLLTFSLDDKISFRNLSLWQKEFLYYADIKDATTFPFVILGNKSDVTNRQVDSEEARAWCHMNRVPYYETSAKTAVNVDTAFHAVVERAQELERQCDTVRNMNVDTVDLTKQGNGVKGDCC